MCSPHNKETTNDVLAVRTYKVEHLVSCCVDGNVDILARGQVGGCDGLLQKVKALLRLLEHWQESSHLVHCPQSNLCDRKADGIRSEQSYGVVLLGFKGGQIGYVIKSSLRPLLITGPSLHPVCQRQNNCTIASRQQYSNTELQWLVFWVIPSKCLSPPAPAQQITHNKIDSIKFC